LRNEKEIIAPRRWGTENRQSGGFLVVSAGDATLLLDIICVIIIK